MKEVLCNGKDYTLLPLTVEPGVNVSDCILVMATDVGTVKGQVLDGDKPVAGWMVVAIPKNSARCGIWNDSRTQRLRMRAVNINFRE